MRRDCGLLAGRRRPPRARTAPRARRAEESALLWACFLGGCALLVSCTIPADMVPFMQPVPPIPRPYAPVPMGTGRRVTIPVRLADGSPYRGRANWCLVVDMPQCARYQRCDETTIEGVIWFDFAENCPLNAVVGRLSLKPASCYYAYDSDRIKADSYQVVLGVTPRPIVLNDADFIDVPCPPPPTRARQRRTW